MGDTGPCGPCSEMHIDLRPDAERAKVDALTLVNNDHPQVVGMALFLCMMSTFFGFGLLSFSQTYAIHCFGLTVLLGVIFAFIYATLFTSSDDKHVVINNISQRAEGLE